MRSIAKIKLLMALAVVCVSSLMGPVLAQTASQPPRGSPLRAALLEATRGNFTKETGGPIEFVVRRLNVLGDWAFGDVQLQRPGGGRIDWRKTRYAESFAEGMFDPSGSYFLLQRKTGVWVLIEFATGPTDVAWDGWRIDHKLPAALFVRQPD